MKKILVIGPAWVGDMVMAQSLFKLIKLLYPQSVLDVLAPTWSLGLLSRMPEVNRSIAMPIGHGELKLSLRYKIARELSIHKYDQAIVLPNSFKSALIPFFAQIPLRTGWRGEMRYGLLNDIRKLDPKKYPLMIERFMALGLSPNESLPQDYPMPMILSDEHTQNEVIKTYDLNRTNQIIALCPGAEFGPAKRWPEEYYAQVANAKLAEGAQVWILGSPKDGETAQKIMTLTENKCVDLTGKTKLVEAIDLLAMASSVVTNDSGLMHIAAALHKPVYAIYGPTSPGFTPPLNKDATVMQLSLPCQPCFQRECPLVHHRCMKDLLPEIILKRMDS